MKKIFVVAVSLFFASVPFFVSAHPGNTDSMGCHTCRTNCPSWGLSYGEYHCHNPKSYIPNIPTPSIPTTPDCPFMSLYDSLSGQCKCMSGYVVGTDFLGNESCVSGDSECQKRYGYGADYDSLSGKCECRSGYLMSGGKCIDDDEYCRDQLGSFSSYDSISDACKCDYGYIINNDKCVNGNSYCQNLLGLWSSYNSSTKKCECDYGYELSGDTCVKKNNSNPIDYFFQTYNQNINTCPVNSSENSSGSCSCNTGYKADPTKSFCVKIDCPLNATLVGNSCVCDVGSRISVGGLYCEKITCPVNASLVNNDCVCNSGYKLDEISATCVLVPQVLGIQVSDNKTKFLTVTTSSNVRVNPNAKAKIIGSAKKGIKYEIVDLSNKDWIKIKLNKKNSGWVSKRLTKIVN